MEGVGDPFFLDGFYIPTETEVQQLKDEVDSHGVKDIDTFLMGKITEWQDAKINIALVGESGVGKSCFINSIRDCIEGDKGYAQVGLGDTTKEPTPYTHPHNENMIFWDLPGVGTTTFPRDQSYFKKVSFHRYDFFLILSDQTFSENDTWLAQEVRRRQKRFFFVRTKLDMEFTRAKHDGTDIAEVIPRIHESCRGNFRAARIKEPLIFVISNFDPEIGQFDDLLNTIFWALPEIKRNAMVLSIGPLTHQIIREKKASLKSRVITVSCMSAGVAAIPIPGLDLAFDVGALVHEISFYLETFGLDEKSLRHLSEKTGTPLDKILASLNQAKALLAVKNGIKTFLLDAIKDQAAKQVAAQFAKFIPIIGTIVSSSVAFGTSYYLLTKTIDDLEKDAHTIIDIVVQSAAKKVT